VEVWVFADRRHLIKSQTGAFPLIAVDFGWGRSPSSYLWYMHMHVAGFLWESSMQNCAPNLAQCPQLRCAQSM